MGDTVAREWRCKWSTENEKASLAAAQAWWLEAKPRVGALAGVKDMKRIVCGGCLDFKIIIAMDAEAFGAWEKEGFAPEADFLAKLAEIPGISNIETQTYTF